MANFSFMTDKQRVDTTCIHANVRELFFADINYSLATHARDKTRQDESSRVESIRENKERKDKTCGCNLNGESNLQRTKNE